MGLYTACIKVVQSLTKGNIDVTSCYFCRKRLSWKQTQLSWWQKKMQFSQTLFTLSSWLTESNVACKYWNSALLCLALPCLALLRSFLMSEDRRSPTRTPRIFTRFCLLHVEHNLQRVFLSIVWYHQSSVFVVFLDVCFRQWYHVGYVCVQRLSAQTTWPKYCCFLRLTLPGNYILAVLCSMFIEFYEWKKLMDFYSHFVLIILLLLLWYFFLCRILYCVG